MAAFSQSAPDSPFDELWRLQQQVDELFSTWSAPAGGIRSLPRGSFPAVNITHTPERVDVFLFAAGIDPKTINISIQQNLLTVAGRRDIPADERATYYRQERFSGEFRRVIALPEDVDPQRVSARYRNGIVEIGLERLEAARPRQIEIH